MKMILSLLIPSLCFAGFSDFGGSDLYSYKKGKVNNRVIKKRTFRKKEDDHSKLLNKLLAEDKKLAEILKRQEKNVIIRRKGEKVTALTRVKGVVLNSILAMNVKPSKFIVRLSDDNELLEGGEIRCLGYSFEKRVPAHCNLLVLNDEEFKVDIDIWDLDGAEGVIADYFYSGEEKTFLTSSFASFLQGVLNVAQDRVSTPFGNMTRDNAKNKVMGGLMGVASNIRDKVENSGEKNLTISYVNSGKEVLVFFNESLKMGKERNK
ncbi:hypothetical protein OAT67_04600 [Bacteriovoracaceae bacterium]|nr:hypothetical protein [Bacteriovoracaceae bacterium]